MWLALSASRRFFIRILHAREKNRKTRRFLEVVRTSMCAYASTCILYRTCAWQSRRRKCSRIYVHRQGGQTLTECKLGSYCSAYGACTGSLGRVDSKVLLAKKNFANRPKIKLVVASEAERRFFPMLCVVWQLFELFQEEMKGDLGGLQVLNDD